MQFSLPVTLAFVWIFLPEVFICESVLMFSPQSEVRFQSRPSVLWASIVNESLDLYPSFQSSSGLFGTVGPQVELKGGRERSGSRN